MVGFEFFLSQSLFSFEVKQSLLKCWAQIIEFFLGLNVFFVDISRIDLIQALCNAFFLLGNLRIKKKMIKYLKNQNLVYTYTKNRIPLVFASEFFFMPHTQQGRTILSSCFYFQLDGIIYLKKINDFKN